MGLEELDPLPNPRGFDLGIPVEEEHESARRQPLPDQPAQAAGLFEALGFRVSQVRGASPLRAFRFRFPWLLATIASGLACAVLVSVFQLTLASSIALAFFVEYLDTSVKTVDDVEKHLSLPVLAVIPTEITVLLKQKRDTADAEAYRILKSNIELNLPDRSANTYTLVSGGPGVRA